MDLTAGPIATTSKITFMLPKCIHNTILSDTLSKNASYAQRKLKGPKPRIESADTLGVLESVPLQG